MLIHSTENSGPYANNYSKSSKFLKCDVVGENVYCNVEFTISHWNWKGIKGKKKEGYNIIKIIIILYSSRTIINYINNNTVV